MAVRDAHVDDRDEILVLDFGRHPRLPKKTTSVDLVVQEGVEARDLTRRYGEGETAVDALRGISLAIERGKLTAIMGPSGSGKSTLIHILAGLDQPTSGDVTIEGTSIAHLDDNYLTKLRREHIGFVFQSFNLLPMLSVERTSASCRRVEAADRLARDPSARGRGHADGSRRCVSPYHAGGYRARARVSATGHGYMAYLPLGLAIGVVLVAFALAAEVRQIATTSKRAELRPQPWHFAVVAPALFACQEHFERLLHDGTFPWDAVIAASFIAGLLLQLPLALIAYALARLLLHAARLVGDLLARRPRRRLSTASIRWPASGFIGPRLAALALGYGSRGPPFTSP